MNNCKTCILSWMLRHPELIMFKKCQTCGYCEVDEEMIKRYPHISPRHRRDGTLAPIPSSHDKKEELYWATSLCKVPNSEEPQS